MSIRPTRVEIDLGALRANAEQVGRVAGVPMYAVVKADGYGHGAVRVARALIRCLGVEALAVSLVEEGVELRKAGVEAPILVMGPALDGGYQELAACDLTAMVSSLDDLEALHRIGMARGEPVSVHLKLDTGMGRLGLEPSLLERVAAYPGVRIEALATHFACADDDDPADPDSMTQAQLHRFLAAAAQARKLGISAPLHAANSAATLRFPTARLDRVRPGLALYGNSPRGQSLRQVMRLATKISQLRDVPAGQSVSYGARWTAARASRLAVLGIGYADGYPRRLSGSAEVLIGGRRCPVAGTISMDITIADVTELGDAVSVGDEAVLLGAQGSERIEASELAERAGVVEYEVTCAISKRVPRIYLEADGS